MARLVTRLKRRLRRNLLFCANGFFPRVTAMPDVKYFGSEYGGWAVQGTLAADAVIYSAGVGEDISFDLAIIAEFGVTVHAFDPTPLALAWISEQSLSPQFKMHSLGLSGADGQIDLFLPNLPGHVSHTILPTGDPSRKVTVPVATVNSIMHMLNHTRVDLLKMDIEGCEYSVIETLIAASDVPSQLLVEYHHRALRMGVARTMLTHQLLTRRGYRLFFMSDLGDEFCYTKK